MNYEQFKNANLGWDNGSCYISDAWSEKYMRKNYEISRNVKREFYKHYDRHATIPQKGDVIEFVHDNKLYRHAAVEGVDKYGVMYVCEQASTHTNGKHFSTSGGAWTHIHISHFEFAGYEERRFWTWGAHGAGGNQGIYFTILVKKWRQKDMPKIKPFVEIYFLNPYYMERGSQVVVLNEDRYIGEEFKTIKRFKEWSAYVGLTYHKEDSERYFANQFLESKCFWSTDELPEGCKPIKAYCNGNKVRCYVHNDGTTITYYRPNPNAKEVYVPMEQDAY